MKNHYLFEVNFTFLDYFRFNLLLLIASSGSAVHQRHSLDVPREDRPRKKKLGFQLRKENLGFIKQKT